MRDRRQRPPTRRDEHGLTTLEWLLIVAAMAGLAALAVVMVSRIVDDTGARVADPNPMIKGITLSAHEIDLSAASHKRSEFPDRDAYRKLSAYYYRKCQRLNILWDHVPGFESWWIAPPAPSWNAPGDLDKNVQYWQLAFGRKDKSMGGCWVQVDGVRISASEFAGYRTHGGIQVVCVGCPLNRRGNPRKTWVPNLNNLSAEDRAILDSLR